MIVHQTIRLYFSIFLKKRKIRVKIIKYKNEKNGKTIKSKPAISSKSE